MDRNHQPTEFDVSIEGGESEKMKVNTGFFVSAAAAAPAILGIEDFPVRIRIWVADLLPLQTPFEFVIEHAGGEALLDASARSPAPSLPRVADAT